MKDYSLIIKELSSIYDNDSMDTFVSLYYNGKDEKFIRKRERICSAILEGEELENFVKTMKKIRKFIEGSAKKIAIFASHRNDYFRVVPLSADITLDIPNALIVDSSPYIRPLTEAIEEWKSFTLLLMNSNHAKIFSISHGEITEEKKMSADIMNKHKKGGWSQARFQRIRKGEIHSFFSEIADALHHFAGENIILAGPGYAKMQFRNSLPTALQKKIIGVIDVDINDEKDLLKESAELMNKREKKEKSQAIQQFKKEILKDGLAIYGIMETMEAIKNGQAEAVLIEKDYKLKGWICENCQIVKKGYTKICPYCGKKTSEVDVIEEIIEFAERMETQIKFIDDEEIKKIGHVGALLRYK
ncbi:MAG: hypothetical protein FE048_00565 [Thermoplasmata archaeon]|nr:MAG: hypothetical protein FE048_00565 [Thermoplasmata archaeon]